MSKTEMLVDGVGTSVPDREVFKFVCCDCGLTHDMVLVAGGRTTPGRVIGLAVRRNKRATAARRRQL